MSEKTTARRSVEGLFLGLTLILIVIGTVVLARAHGLPPLASDHGAGIDRMINYLLISVGLLFALGHIVLGYLVWRFSRQEEVTFRLPGAKAEKVWSLAPILLMTLIAEGGVLVLGLPVWAKFYGSTPPEDAVTVEVTAEQFAWTFRYPGADGVYGTTDPGLISPSNPLGLDHRDPAARDDIVEAAELFLPVNRPARVRLKSRDTLHSFFLPHHRVKQDAVPGMTIEVWFVPTREGEFEIVCAELCGLGHYQMRGVLRVVSQENFEQWLREH